MAKEKRQVPVWIVWLVLAILTVVVVMVRRDAARRYGFCLQEVKEQAMAAGASSEQAVKEAVAECDDRFEYNVPSERP